MTGKLRNYLMGLGAGLVSLANNAVAGMEFSFDYARGFNNLEAEKTVFTSASSPDQEHGLNAGFDKFEFTGAYVSDKAKKGFRFKTGAGIFYGQANDAAEDVASYGSSGSETLEGTADFDMNADVLGIGAFVGVEKRFFKDKLRLSAKLGAEVAGVDAKLNGRGYVSSSSGDLAAGNTLSSEIQGALYDAYVGADASVYLAEGFKVFVGAKYSLGNNLSWDETQTDVTIVSSGATSTGTGKGSTTGGVTLGGLEVLAGITHEF